MALSDELTKLAARANETETRAEAARSKARGDLEQEVASARAAAQAQGEELRKAAAEAQGEISDWWVDAQRSWEERIGAVREDIERKKAGHDVGKARRRAERYESDAMLAIDAAYWAVVEAEYAVLDAVLARMDADDVAAAKGEAPRPASSQS
jgi:ribosome-binding ATPase YchF (GTP1/OBG family)